MRAYKDAGARADEWAGKAVKNKHALKQLHDLSDIVEAAEATENYIAALQEEARERVAHTRRFFAHGVFFATDCLSIVNDQIVTRLVCVCACGPNV